MIDELTRHSIYLGRYSNGILREMSPELKALRDDVATRILTATEYESARLSLLMADLNKIIDGHFLPLTNTIFNSVDELAAYEQQYALSLLDDATIGSVVIGAGANVSLLQAYVKNDAVRMVGEAPQTIGSMIDTFNSAYKRDINTIISTGILEGKTTKEMARTVSSLSNTRSRRQAEALVRTIVNHTGASARKRTFQDNRNLFVGEKFFATLDGRTSLTCSTRDGGIWDYNGAPLNSIARGSTFARPPLHYNCRSLLVDEIKEQYKIIKDGTRASTEGPVSESTTYGDWLKRQPKAVQDKVLGKTRAELFRSGKLTLDKFTDKTGEIYTLKELGVADSVMKPSLVPDIKFGYGGKFDGYVKDIRPEAKMVIDKLPKPNNITSVSSNATHHFSFSTGSTISTIDNKSVFNHEYGHHLDLQIATKAKSGTLYYSKKQLLEEYKLDRDFGGYNSYDFANDYFEKNYAKIDVYGQRGKYKGQLIGYKYDMIDKTDYKSRISDMYDSLSMGKIQDLGGIGHGVKYYKSTENIMTENFANMFSIWSDGAHWEDAKKLFPNMTSKFELIMQEVQDGKFD